MVLPGAASLGFGAASTDHARLGGEAHFHRTATGSYEEAAAVANRWGRPIDDSTLLALVQRVGARGQAQAQARYQRLPQERQPERAPSALAVANLQDASVRARVTPRHSQTTPQQRVRARLAAIAGGWRGLTDPQRALWKGYAVPLPGKLSSCNAYLQVNSIRVLCGDALFESPPPMPAFGILSLTALDAVHDFAAPHAFRMALRATNTVAPDRYIVEATPAVKSGHQQPLHHLPRDYAPRQHR